MVLGLSLFVPWDRVEVEPHCYVTSLLISCSDFFVVENLSINSVKLVAVSVMGRISTTNAHHLIIGVSL